MCPNCLKKWKDDVESLGKLVRSLVTDAGDFATHLRKTSEEIEKKLARMKDQFKHAR
jgi:hypothetical protein